MSVESVSTERRIENPTSPARGRLQGIQVLRLLAAGAVLVQHGIYLSQIAYGSAAPFFATGWLGVIGVFLFFLISGFVISGLIETPPARFAIARVLRIYPPLIMAIVIGGGLGLLFKEVSWGDLQWRWSLLALPVGDGFTEWSRVPYWTLLYEVVFYLVTYVLMLARSPKLFDGALVAWTLLIVVTNHDATYQNFATTSFTGILMSPASLLFIAGAALSRALRGSVYPLLVSAFIAFGGTYIGYAPSIAGVMNFTGAMLPIVYLATRLPIRAVESPPMRALIRGGDCSYGLYLLHAPIIYAAIAALAGVLPVTGMAVVATLFGGAGGLLFGFLEFRFHQRMAKRLAAGLALRPGDDRDLSLRGRFAAEEKK
jgi:peptidoglycan/LPS O-acetylase OafA/YrhL